MQCVMKRPKIERRLQVVEAKLAELKRMLGAGKRLMNPR
jgi:hypothetical protein